MRKISVFIFAVVLILSCTVTAEADTPTAFYKYIIEDGEVTLTYAETSKNVLNIPAEIEGMPVTKIKSDVFFYLFKIGGFDAINIPASITSLETPVVFDMASVKAINVDKKNPAYSSEDGVLFDKDKTVILYYPNRKDDKTYLMPDSVKRVENYAFKGARFYSLELSENLEEIGTNAFYKAGNLRLLNLPRKLKTIEDDAFVLNYSLAAVTVDRNNPYFSASMGVLFNKDKTELIYYPVNGESETYEIPDTVKVIGVNAFQWPAELKKLTLPKGLERIEERGLSGIIKSEITLPESLEYIGKNAFESCDFTELKVPENVRELGDGAFKHCNTLKAVELPEGITYIGEEAFFYAYALKKITIPQGVTEIRNKAFEGCSSLDEVIIPGTVTKIGENVFDYCSDNIVIYGFTGSASEIVADNYGYDFISIDNSYTACVTGDANLDGRLNIRDATLIQKHLAKLAVLGDTAKAYGDADGNGKLDIRDTTAIQRQLSGSATLI